MKQIILQILVLNFTSKRQARSPGQDISCFVYLSSAFCLARHILTNDKWQPWLLPRFVLIHFLWLFWGNSSLGKIKKRKEKYSPCSFSRDERITNRGGWFSCPLHHMGLKIPNWANVCNTRLDNTPCYQRFMLHQSQSGGVPSGVGAVN